MLVYLRKKYAYIPKPKYYWLAPIKQKMPACSWIHPKPTNKPLPRPFWFGDSLAAHLFPVSNFDSLNLFSCLHLLVTFHFTHLSSPFLNLINPVYTTLKFFKKKKLLFTHPIISYHIISYHIADYDRVWDSCKLVFTFCYNYTFVKFYYKNQFIPSPYLGEDRRGKVI